VAATDDGVLRAEATRAIVLR